MKKLLLILTFISFTLQVSAQTASFDWIKKIGDSGTDCPGQIANDTFGNVYAAGSFVGQLILGNDTLHSTSVTSPSMFLAKFDPFGTILWAKKLPLTYTINGDCSGITLSKLKVSASGKIHLVGWLNYNGIRGYLVVLRNNGSLVGYDNNALGDQHSDIDVDSLDNLYLTGTTTSSSFYVAKFDSAGNDKWGYLYTPSNKGCNIMYSNGNVYVAGQFRYQMQLSDTMGSPSITVNASGGINDWDFFKAKYSSSGKLLSVIRNDGLISAAGGPFKFGSDFTSTGKWRVADVSNGSIAYTKEYDANLSLVDSATILSTGCPTTVSCYLKTSEFNEQSIFTNIGITQTICASGARHLDSIGAVKDDLVIPSNGLPSYFPIADFSFDRQKNIFINCSFQGTINYQDSTGQKSMTSLVGSQDIFVAKYHTCKEYEPQITENNGTLFCTVFGVQYQWYLSGNPISGANNQTYTPTQSGNYTVEVIESWQCSRVSPVYSLGMSAVPTISTGRLIQIYPNPVVDCLNVVCKDIYTQPLRLDITDLAGKKIELNAISNTLETYVIRTALLVPGIYVLRASFPNGSSESLQFIKQNN